MEHLIGSAPRGRLCPPAPAIRGQTQQPGVGLPGAPRCPDVVVGLGNEIARDDGVGIAAARELERRLAGHGRHPRGELSERRVEVVPLPWAGFALLDVLVGRRRAALIDCLVTGDHPPGTVVRLDEGDVRGSVRLNSFHDVAFPTVLALGRDLGWAMPGEVAIWAIEAAVVDRFGEGLTAPVAAAVHRVVDEVLAYLRPKRPSPAARLPWPSPAVPGADALRASTPGPEPPMAVRRATCF